MSSTRAVMSRLSTTLLRTKFKTPISQTQLTNNLLKSTSQSSSASAIRISPFSSRLPVECTSCILTMLPLHSAIASARLQSVLSVDSQTWCLVPQGMSMPL